MSIPFISFIIAAVLFHFVIWAVVNMQEHKHEIINKDEYTQWQIRHHIKLEEIKLLLMLMFLYFIFF